MEAGLADALEGDQIDDREQRFPRLVVLAVRIGFLDTVDFVQTLVKNVRKVSDCRS